jgi:hypothetical protein
MWNSLKDMYYQSLSIVPPFTNAAAKMLQKESPPAALMLQEDYVSTTCQNR